MCLDDFARTVQFIRGVHDAITTIRKHIDERPVRVLYAGCGPWAPLAIPLMSVLSSNDVRFTLLDIHRESIESAKRLVEAFGFSNYVTTFEVADAATYQIGEPLPDLIVIEMLRTALQSEPQVAVATHLHRQAPNAMMVPEEVRVDLSLIDNAREHTDVEARDRIHIGTLLKLDRDTLGACKFEPVTLTLPDFDQARYRPMFLTTIRVYDGHHLRDYDSGITIPKRVNLRCGPGDQLEFRYEVSRDPGIAVRVIDAEVD